MNPIGPKKNTPPKIENSTNGAGTSTLFKMIAGFLVPSRGRIVYQDRPIQGMRPHVIAGRMTIGKALGVIGARIQGDIQQRISSNVPPPNAPSTIAAKARGSGSATTLINYGQLRGTVHFAVVNAH